MRGHLCCTCFGLCITSLLNRISISTPPTPLTPNLFYDASTSKYWCGRRYMHCAQAATTARPLASLHACVTYLFLLGLHM